jgi:hypothetical protein
LRSVIRYFSQHQAIDLDNVGEIKEMGPKHDDGIEHIVCGHCQRSLTDNPVPEIQRLVERVSEH